MCVDVMPICLDAFWGPEIEVSGVPRSTQTRPCTWEWRTVGSSGRNCLSFLLPTLGAGGGGGRSCRHGEAQHHLIGIAKNAFSHKHCNGQSPLTRFLAEHGTST